MAHDKPGSEIAPRAPLNQDRIGWVHRALPDWILTASSSDQATYGRYMMDLAALHLRHAGKAFDDGIKHIGDFALDAIHTLMVKDHPGVARTTLDSVRISVTSVQAWGTLIVPGNTQTQTFTLAELALENLIALPLGNKTVGYENGSAVPPG